MTSTGTVGLLSPAGAPSSSAALARVHRYLYEELGPQRGPAGVGLARARALFGGLGHPQDRFPAVHLAGTAGKGSVITFVASLLRAHGFRVGTHLSPHVYCLLERFQVDGEPAPAELVDAARARIRPAVEAVERVAEVEDALSAKAVRRGCALRWVDLGAPAVQAWTGPGGTALAAGRTRSRRGVLLRGEPPPWGQLMPSA